MFNRARRTPSNIAAINEYGAHIDYCRNRLKYYEKRIVLQQNSITFHKILLEYHDCRIEHYQYRIKHQLPWNEYPQRIRS